MIKQVIVADDFTGGLDTGVMFAKEGFKTWMTESGIKADDDIEECVLTLAVPTRHLKSECAQEKVRRAAEYARWEKIPLLYKKTDSLLRGNIGAELEGMIRGSGRNLVIFVPAHPEMGRTVEGGRLLIHGKPIAETVYSKDLNCPIKQSYVADILKKQTKIPVTEVGVLAETPVVKMAPEIFICDTGSEEDLKMIAEAVRPVADRVILAGCAGFAKYVSHSIAGLYMEKKLQGDIQWWQGKGHTAFCGSVNEQTRKQIKYAEEKGVFTYKLPLDILISSSLPEYEMDHILSMQKEKKEILFYTVSGGGDIERTVRAAKQMGLSQKETYKKVAERLGQIASICMRAGNRRNFTVIGGDTLCETMKAADYRKIEPLAELYPGVILAKIYYKKGDERFVVSKAGSFGDDTIIWKIFRKAGGQSRN